MSNGITTMTYMDNSISQCESDVLVVDDQNVQQCLNMPMLALKNMKRAMFLASTVTSLPKNFFAYHPSLEEVYLPHNLVELPEGLFKYSSIKKVVMHNSVQAFGEHCFRDCKKLHSLQLPHSLKSIGANCFINSSIDSISFNARLEKIEQYAFENTKLEKVHLLKGHMLLEDGVFHRCYSLEEAIVESDIEEVPEFLFNSCIKLKRVYFYSNALKSIKQDAFTNCPSLEYVEVHSNVDIADEAFNSKTDQEKCIHVLK